MKTKIFLVFILNLAICCSSSTTKSDSENNQSKQIIKKNNGLDTIINKSQDVLYVKAKSGLIIRKKPRINSEKLGKFYYSDKVEIIKKTQINKSITDQGKIIKGEWYKVSGFEPNHITGYVFSGFLSKKKIEHPYHISIIDNLPYEIDGCSYSFSLNKNDFEIGNKKVFISTYGDMDESKNFSLVKINGTFQKLHEEKNYWKNADFKLYIETKKVNQIDEYNEEKGKMILKSKDGFILETEIYGSGGC